MAKEEVVGTAKAPDRLEIIWQTTARNLSWLDFKPKKPDMKAIGAQMEKTRKPAELVLTWDGKKLALVVRVGSNVTPLGGRDLAAERDPAARHALLKNLSDHSSLLPASKLPPDPTAVDELRRRVGGLKQQLAHWEDARKKLPRKYDQLDQGQQEVGLGNWAKGKNLDRFPRFLMAVDWGRDPAFVVAEFLADGAPSPVGPKLKPATRKAILDAHAAGKPPGFAAARKEVVQLVDGFMMPAYAKHSQQGIDKEIQRLRAEMKAEAEKLKALTR